MRKLLSLAATILCLVCPNTWGQSTCLRTNGAQLIDSTGTAVQLRGTNLGNWLVPEGYMFQLGQVNAPRLIEEFVRELVGPTEADAFWAEYLDTYITTEDIAYLKAVGSNHVRLPFHYKLFVDEPFLGTRNAGFTYLDRCIKWCREQGLYVLLDMHCAPGGQTGDNIDDSYGYPYLLTDEAEQDEFVRIWTRIAEHYAGDPVIAGYDLANEPVAHYFKEEQPKLDAALGALYTRTVDAIRGVDPDHAIWLNGSIWASDFSVFGDMAGGLPSNTVYEFHKYWTAPTAAVIEEYSRFRDSLSVPIYLGESGENTDGWVDSFRLVLDREDIGYAFWPYKKMRPRSCLRSIEMPPSWEPLTAYAKGPRATYAEIREQRPSRDSARAALRDFLNAAPFGKTRQNVGYVRALGLKEE